MRNVVVFDAGPEFRNHGIYLGLGLALCFSVQEKDTRRLLKGLDMDGQNWRGLKWIAVM